MHSSLDHTKEIAIAVTLESWDLVAPLAKTNSSGIECYYTLCASLLLRNECIKIAQHTSLKFIRCVSSESGEGETYISNLKKFALCGDSCACCFLMVGCCCGR